MLPANLDCSTYLGSRQCVTKQIKNQKKIENGSVKKKINRKKQQQKEERLGITWHQHDLFNMEFSDVEKLYTVLRWFWRKMPRKFKTQDGKSSEAIRGQWEGAYVSQFVRLFQHKFGFQSLTTQDLEDALLDPESLVIPDLCARLLRFLTKQPTVLWVCPILQSESSCYPLNYVPCAATSMSQVVLCTDSFCVTCICSVPACAHGRELMSCIWHKETVEYVLFYGTCAA